MVANMKAGQESPVRKAIVIKFFNLISQSVLICCKSY